MKQVFEVSVSSWANGSQT